MIDIPEDEEQLLLNWERRDKKYNKKEKHDVRKGKK